MSPQFDVIIIGGGISGLIAANRAVDYGLRALLLEKGASKHYSCNTRYAGGTYHVCLKDVMSVPSDLANLLHVSSRGYISLGHAQVLASNAAKLIDWLISVGMEFVKISDAEHHRWAMAPQGRTQPGLSWKGLAGDVLLERLAERLTLNGGKLILNSRVTDLLTKDGACIGVKVNMNNSGISTDVSFTSYGVFIADGGFQSNLDLLKKHITPRPNHLKQRGGATGMGDGLKMAVALGAQVVGMSSFYGHTLSKDAMFIDRLWPYPYLDNLVTAGIVVDEMGNRFVDEGRGGVYVANKIANLPDPLSTFVIFDDSVWQNEGKKGLIPANPHIPSEGGTVFCAMSVEELAEISHIHKENLKRCIDKFNVNVAKNNFKNSISPSREDSSYRPRPIVSPPFFAIPMCVGITHTMGGLAVNPFSQVLHQNGEVIKGLYAIGASSGSFEGGPEITYVGGLVKGGVNAMVSIEHFYTNLKLN